MYPECMPPYVETGMLYAAAMHGRFEAIPIYLRCFSPTLLEHPPPYFRLRDIATLSRALACACLSRSLKAVLALIKSAPPRRIYYPIPQAALDPLTCAVVGGSLKVAAYIIKFSLTRPPKGETVVKIASYFAAALTAASRTGRCKMVALLLNHGTSVDALDFRSPVFAAGFF